MQSEGHCYGSPSKVVHSLLFYLASSKSRKETDDTKKKAIQGDLKNKRPIYCDVGVGGPKRMVH